MIKVNHLLSFQLSKEKEKYMRKRGGGVSKDDLTWEGRGTLHKRWYKPSLDISKYKL